MKKKAWFIGLGICIAIGGVFEALDEPESKAGQESESTETEIASSKKPPAEEKVTDAERLGVSEKTLDWIEKISKQAGWEYTRADYESITVKREDDTFIVYTITTTDGTEMEPTIRKTLID